MKHHCLMLVGMLLATAHAAEPAPPSPIDAEPAVVTSPAAASDPVVGRGNPRQPAVSAGEAPPADAAADDAAGAAPIAAGAAPASAVPAASAPVARGSADRIELDATQITGNSELPRVMYVVPWKRPELGELGGRPAKSLLDEVLEPVDRDVFRRQNRYYRALQPQGAAEP